ncbi:MAG: hypothetical protein C4538_00595 [Nitrospiraceae bacterium]|nr:MAG: hypothetical protein C4538_00595 [Nitrospiraceae bacterium]
MKRNEHALRMELKKQTNLAAGLVSDRFPAVSDIVINMKYYRKGANPVLMLRTLNIVPASYAIFKMDCMIRGCDGGGFDLTSVVADMIKTHKKVKKGAIVCHGNIDERASDHASIEYETVIHYK